VSAKWKKVFLTEKDSQVEALAKILNAKYTSKWKPAINEKERIAIVPLQGHVLVGLEPHEYSEQYASFGEDGIYVFPEKYLLKPKKGTEHLLKTALDFLKNTEEIYICTDFDEEGAAIGLNVIEYGNIPKSKIVKMVQMGSLHPEALKKAVYELPGVDYEKLAASGRTRAFIDWAEGMSLSRALSFYFKNKSLNFGGVKSPVIYMVVKRDNEHDNHKKAYYYVIKAITKFNNKEIVFTVKKKVVERNGDKEKIFYTEKFDSKEEAEKIKEEILSKKEIFIYSINKSIKRTSPPKLYELTSLQGDMASQKKIKPDQTMEIAQKLYSPPYTIQTYPRSAIPYLKSEEYEDVPIILQKLKRLDFVPDYIIDNILSGEIPKRKTVFNDEEVTSHGAIIPTRDGDFDTYYPKLNDAEKTMFQNVSKKYIAAFMPDYEYKKITVKAFYDKTKKEDYILEYTEHIPLVAGWKELYEPKLIDEIRNYKSLVEDMKENISLSVSDISILQKETKPKPLFNYKSLLLAMENIANLFPENEDIKKYLNEGIGTPSTRSTIIKELLDEKKNKGFPWLYEEKDKIRSTDKAKKFISIIPNELVSPIKRAILSKKLKLIAQGKLSSEQVINEYREEVRKNIELIKSIAKEKGDSLSSFSSNNQKPLGQCPKCKNGQIIERGKVFMCSESKLTKDENGKWKNDGCDYVIFKSALSKMGKNNITATEVSKMLKNGKVEVNLISKAGKKYTAYMVPDLKWGVKVEFKDFSKNNKGKK